MPSADELYRRHISRMWTTLLGPAIEVSAKGARVIDDRGREYLDCGSYAVFLLGHGHPAVVEAVREQIERLPLASGMFLTREHADAAVALASVAPQGLERVCFTNSGTEATELALKLARLNGFTTAIVMEGAFHGMTLGALSLSGNPVYAARFGPLIPNIIRVPFGDLQSVEAQLEQACGSACVVVEPIQGENGVLVPPPDYLASLAQLCASYESLLICDEIQCGLGRAGSWWVSEAEGCSPDVLLTGKILSGGVVPVAAVVASAAIHEPLDRDPMLHGSTFAGSPIQCAAVSATVAALQTEGLIERSRTLGLEVKNSIIGAVDGHAHVVDVRGRGLMIGIEFADPGIAARFFLSMFENGVITAPCSTRPTVVRLLPPAVISPTEVSELIEAVRVSATAVSDNGRSS